MYAAPPTRETIDTWIDGVAHGLFTYWLCDVLEQSDPDRLSYRRLMEQIYNRYDNDNRPNAPTPQIEGEHKDTIVLGTRELRDASIRLRRQGGEFTINAGRLHDAHEDTILAVYPRDGLADSNQPLGFVQVTRARASQAWVEPCACIFNGTTWAKSAALPDSASCEIVQPSYKGLRRLAVRLLDKTAFDEALPSVLKRRWENRIRQLEFDDRPSGRDHDGRNPLLYVVTDVSEADWLIQIASLNRSETVHLLPVQQYRERSFESSVQVAGRMACGRVAQDNLEQHLAVAQPPGGGVSRHEGIRIGGPR